MRDIVVGHEVVELLEGLESGDFRIEPQAVETSHNGVYLSVGQVFLVDVLIVVFIGREGRLVMGATDIVERRNERPDMVGPKITIFAFVMIILQDKRKTGLGTVYATTSFTEQRRKRALLAGGVMG